MISYIITSGLAVFLYFLLKFNKQPDPILGIYTQPGKWYYLKYVTFMLIVYYRKYMLKLQKYIAAGEKNKDLIIAEENISLEKAQVLSMHPKAFDAAFFIGANKDGFYMIGGSERRHMGTINGLFYLIIPGRGVLCSPKIPDTLLFGANPNEFGAEGILLTPVEPMKKWHVSYNGKMWYQSDPTKIVNVSFTGEWNAKWKYFNYDTDLNTPTTVRSIAREKWSREYFDNLKGAHQTHYEQFGKMDICFKIDDETFQLTMDSFRDHSYGHKRDWELMHRYGFHHIFCENGLSAAVGVICQPCTATSFEVGVVCLPTGENHIYPVEWCDLNLYQHGESGHPPVDYAFRFQANGQIYVVEVLVQHQSEHFVSSNWDARMVERFVKYTVNGVSGWGVSEFHYNNKNGRPEKYSLNDPDWYKRMKTT